MSNNAAQESKLGALHERVAQILLLTLENYETRQRVVHANLEELKELAARDESGLLKGIDILSLAKEEVPVNLVMAAISFLKNNEITCIPEASGGVSELEQRLHDKRAKRSIANLSVVS